MSSYSYQAGQIHNTKIKPNHIRSRLWWKIHLIYGGISTTGYLFISTKMNLKTSVRRD